MRLNHLIQFVNGWFERVVYRDDAWDERLNLVRGSNNIAVNLVGHLLAGLVWLIRRVLWCLMILGRLLNGWLLRQMELDADRYAARLAGSDVFKKTTRRAIELALADALARKLLLSKWQRKGLPENLPTFTVSIADSLPQDVRLRVDEVLNRRATRLFDTHPAPKDRIRSVAREPVDGIFHWDMPASRLFVDFERLSSQLTFETYQAAFGLLVSNTDLLPVETFWERTKVEMS